MTAIFAVLASDLRDLCRSGITCAELPLDLENFFKTRNVVMSFESDKEICFSLDLDAPKSEIDEVVDEVDSLRLLQIVCYLVTSLAGVLVIIVQLVKLARCASPGSTLQPPGDFLYGVSPSHQHVHMKQF